MKATGICRRLDELGRRVLPIELRRAFDIPERGALEIFTDGDRIILRKYQPDCIFCGSMEDLKIHQGKQVCKACRKQLRG
jgi:transcriptional pleiotropic regulator of transition state genes